MIRLVWRAAGVLAGLAVCIPLHYLWRFLGLRSPWPRRFLGWAGRRCGLVVATEGGSLERNVLFAANHVSWLDILALGGTSKASFVAKDEVRRWPAFGWLAAFNDTLYVVRHARHQVQGQADQIRSALASGRAVALFPEGTIGDGPGILPFRASLFASLFPPLPEIRVQPVALDYGKARAGIAWMEGESTAANARRILSRRGKIPVTIRFLAPIDPQEAGGRKALAARAEAEVAASLAAANLLYGPR